MTVECKIGPIELDAAQLVDGDLNERPQDLERYLSPGGRRLSHGLRDKNEGFSIYCKKYQALQISGLAGWNELEWIDSSTSLLNNDDIVHRGWGLLGKTNLLVYPGVYSDLEMEVAIASTNENETLLMDYVKGAYSQLLVGYDEDAREYLVQDPFDNFSNLIWTDPISYRVSSPVVYPSSGTLFMQGIKSSGGYGALFTKLKAILPSKFTLETGIDTSVSYTPASTAAVYLSTIITTKADWSSFFSGSGSYSAFADAIVISVGITYSGGVKVYTVYVYQFDEDGTEKMLISPFSTTAAVHDIRVELNDNGNIDIYFDDVKKYSGPSGLSTVHEGLHAGYALDISDTATPSATYWMKATYMNVYIDRTFPQQVILPPYSRTSETPTAYRKTMWGDLPVFENPTGGVPFQTTPADYDKAGPRAWSDDNEDGELRRIFNPDEVIDLGETKKIITNNLVYANAATGTTLSRTTTGFSSFGTTLGSSTEWSLTLNGRSLKVNCPGTQSGERAWAPSEFSPSIGQSYAGRIVFKGTPGDSFIIVIQMLNSPYTTFATSATIQATWEKQTIDVSGVCPADATTIGILIRKVNTSTNPFFIGQTLLVPGTSIPDFDYIDPITGDLVKLEKSKETEFYLENGIIKIEPTPNSVKLYAFESLLTDNQHNVLTDLSGLIGWADNDGKCTFQKDTNLFKTGNGSAKLRSTYNGSQGLGIILWKGDRFSIDPNEDYYLTAVQIFAYTADDKIMYARIRWYDYEGNPLSGDDEWTIMSLGNATPMEWTEFSEQKITPPPEAKSCYLEFYAPQFLNNEILYYDSCQFGRWKLQEEIPLGDEEPIRLIRIKEISRELITVQINNTTWTMRRGDPVVEIKHPNTQLGLCLDTCYSHDSTTTVNPEPSQDITMESQHYLLKWDAGDNIIGTYKWADSVLASNGKAYGIPDRAQEILIVDSATGTVTLDNMGATIPKTTSQSLWLGGVLAGNGKIYCIPFDATTILIIDPATGTATTSTMGATLTGSAKWYGGVLGADGKIYGIPYDATDILIIDPTAGTAARSAMGATLTGGAKWAGGVKANYDYIYAIPNNATDILRIYPAGGTATRSNMSCDLTGSYKWIGGVKAPNGDIYGIPNNAQDILIIPTGGGFAMRDALGATLTGTDKWCKGVLGSDGKIYGIPSTAADILIINPSGSPSATRSNMGCTNLVGSYKWFSGVSGGDTICAFPEDADDFLLIDITGGTATRTTLGLGTCANPVPAQNLRTLIVQTTPTTIKSDQIPPTSETGIGVVDINESPSNPSGYLTLAGWFVNRGRQKIKLP